MAKYTQLNADSCDFIGSLFTNSVESEEVACKKLKLTKTTKSMFSFVQKILLENKLKQTYRKLDNLCTTVEEELKQKQICGELSNEMHPLQEQEWLVEAVRKKLSLFTIHDIWRLILHHEQREKYAKYIQPTHDLDHFELFFQNNFIPALTKKELRELFLHIFEEEATERDTLLHKFFKCLHYKQGKYLLEALMQRGLKNKALHNYCKCMLDHMRSSQISQAVCLLPKELESEALKKLYPYEVLDVIENQQDESKKKELITKILSSCRSWWSAFPPEEIDKTLSLLSTK